MSFYAFPLLPDLRSYVTITHRGIVIKAEANSPSSCAGKNLNGFPQMTRRVNIASSSGVDTYRRFYFVI